MAAKVASRYSTNSRRLHIDAIADAADFMLSAIERHTPGARRLFKADRRRAGPASLGPCPAN
jgi:hypothetical protein